MRTARSTKWSASSALYTYGSPCPIPHRRSARPPASTAARHGHAQRREISAVGIDRVVATRVDTPEAGLGNLIARVVADVDDRVDEDGGTEREDRDAARPQAMLERVRPLGHVGARLAARDDVVLADRAEDPASVRDQLVVGQ